LKFSKEQNKLIYNDYTPENLKEALEYLNDKFKEIKNLNSKNIKTIEDFDTKIKDKFFNEI